MSTPPADVIVVGAGLIGLTLGRELHQRGFRVLIFDRGEAGREASWAGAGMLAGMLTSNPVLRPLALAGAKLYPVWAADLERETYLSVGYRRSGTIIMDGAPQADWEPVDAQALEPEVRTPAGAQAWLLRDDHSVDNRAVVRALVASVRARGVELREHTPVEAIEVGASAAVVVAGGERIAATVVINAAGAWAGGIPAPFAVPVRPRKGQMLRLKTPLRLQRVVEAPGVYLVPREGGRILVGATVEDVGFNREVDRNVITELRQRAEGLVPALVGAEMEECWSGLRPCAPDELPIIGPTSAAGYWVATAHYRDGILLAPLTAKIVTNAMREGRLTQALDLKPFLPRRFETGG